MGETLTALPPGPLWRSDRRASLDVRLRGGVLASVTADAALGGANALALLDAAGAVEIVTAAQVELIGERMFRLSGLLRGIGGSEPAAGRSLPPGSQVVVLDGAAVPLTGDLGDLGLPRRYRIGPAQHDVGDPSMVEITAAASPAVLRPLSPVHPVARRVGAHVRIAWIRRTRIDGDSWDLLEVPLGEDAERYELTILDGDVAVRSVITAAPGWDYPAAMELVDFGTARSELTVAIAQLSTVVGRGHEWRGRVPVA